MELFILQHPCGKSVSMGNHIAYFTKNCFSWEKKITTQTELDNEYYYFNLFVQYRGSRCLVLERQPLQTATIVDNWEEYWERRHFVMVPEFTLQMG